MSETVWAREGDRRRLEAFFRERIEDAMFPSANLRAHGLSGAGHRHATRFLMTIDSGRIKGTLGLTRNGMLLPTGRPDTGAAIEMLAGVSVSGAAGPAETVREAISACGVADGEISRSSDETQSAVGLADLKLPATQGLELLPLHAAPRHILIGWRADLLTNETGFVSEMAERQAADDIDAYLEAGTHRVLMSEGKPVAMTGFNTMLEDIVQVGGVYTRPDLRGRGLARAAVALHLMEARAEGVLRAVLFSMSAAANRAYRALGFEQNGRFGLVLLHAPHEVLPCR